MAFLAHIGIAVAVVQAEQRRRGVWADLTIDQKIAIRHVVADDDLGRLTRTELVNRLHQIASPPDDGWRYEQ